MSFERSRRVLFAHDGPLLTDSQGQFYGVTLDDRLRKRYLQLGGHVTFLMRNRVLGNQEAGRYRRIEKINFSYVKVPDFKSPATYVQHRRTADQIIEHAVRSADVLVARLPSIIGRRAVHYAREQGKPYMVEVVACTFDALWHHSWLGKLRAPYAFLTTRRAILNAPFAVYVTKEFLQRRYPTLGVSDNISDVNLRGATEDVLTKRLQRVARFGSERPLVLGTLGNLNVRYKGQQHVIKALGALKKHQTRFEYRLAGSGDDSGLRKMVRLYGLESQVRFCGAIAHDQVFDWLDDVDIYVQPSDTEGLPRAVIEAMSRGCMVVGSNVGGIPELIDPACVFRRGNWRELVGLLLKIDSVQMENQARNGIKSAARFSPEVLQSKRSSLYQAFLKTLPAKNVPCK